MKKGCVGLYERYGKPLEKDHRNEYLTVFKDDRILVMVVGRDDLEVTGVALKTGQKPFHLYKIGQKYVHKIRH